MEALLVKQSALIDQINRAYTNYKKSPKERLTKSYITTRLEMLEKYWSTFTNHHYELIVVVKQDVQAKQPYFVEDFYETTEESYTDYKSKLKEDLEGCLVSSPNPSKNANSEVRGTSSTNPEVKLPQIQLPTFSGLYEEWQSFHDMFVSLIHNNQNLSAVQKLHYLKSSLTGEPENLLKSLSTTEMNYEEAWNKLMRRYNNKRYNSNEILKRLFSQKTITHESASAIKQMLDTTTACLKSLKNLGVDTSSWDVIITYIIVSKLDYESRRQWETEVSQSVFEDFPTWDQLMEFLERRFRTLEIIDGSKHNMKSSNTANTKVVSKQKAFHSTLHEDRKEKQKVCVLCSSPHYLYQCKQFGMKSPEMRSEFIQSKRLCFNCLAPTHNVKNCHQATCCRRCGRRHHTLLHLERSQLQESSSAPILSNEQSSSPVNEATQQSRDPEKKVVAHFAKEEHQGNVLLATALVRVKSKNGYKQFARVLIDQGSEASFITESTVQSLGLTRTPVNGLVSGVGDGTFRTKSIVEFDLESLNNSEFSISVNAFVLTSLTSFLPSNKTSIIDWPEIYNLPLADPQYGTPGKIDIILGADTFGDIILSGLLKHPSSGGPVAQNTQLGWILSGRVDHHVKPSLRVVNLHLKVKEDYLLKQFWEIEREPDLLEKKLSKEEIRCEEIYESTTMRNSEGRYIVRLPFRDPDPKCRYGRSKDIAQKRFSLLEKKFKKNPVLHAEYQKVISEYMEQNYLEVIEEEKERNNPYAVYLPHHAVVREEKATTKVRVVMDASCKGVNNVSLNDTLMVGPKLQQDLRHILMRWRTHPYCVLADIVKMYLQVMVNEEDVNYQRILWRPTVESPMQNFKLLRLTFGTACAPYLAVKTLQRLAEDEQVKNPLAANITMHDFYMDDLLTGCETEEEAIDIYVEMNNLMKKGGFRLQKWCSNSKNLLDHIEKDNQQSNESFIFKSNDTIKILGISWNKNSDKFEYTYKLPELTENVTKRQVLSDIARLYDPMGWIAPVLINAKIFMQTLWKSGLSWDERLSPELLDEWLRFREDLNQVQHVQIPRWLQAKKNDTVELHVFADASQMAYAAVVYAKQIDKDSNSHINIISAKTKVAPIEKEISIPRMELCAALLATKLIFEVAQVLHVPKDKLFAWSDSTIVLAWIRGEPNRWNTFVSNRVSEIQSVLEPDQWNHVITTQNPADCASRGIAVAELINHDLWWHGPESIQQNHYNKHSLDFTTDLEERSKKTFATAVQTKENFIWQDYSNLSTMLRIFSYCRKFLKLKEPKQSRVLTGKTITFKEMNETLKACVRRNQEFYFEDEIKQIRTLGSVTKKSLLHTLSPFLDDNGLLRVGGRIDQASVPFDKKHPLIMPAESYLTGLIVSDAHHKTLHGGPQVMMNLLRSKFWIIRMQERVKRCYRECTTCIRYSRQNNNQFMGQLPSARLTPGKPFRLSGVDFTGHINIRFSPGRGSRAYKGYICLFVCMSTRAIHLEAVSDLTANGFIAAFRRFVSRRGHCQHLYCDNGTTFVGSERELQERLTRAKSQLPDEIAHLLANDGTTFHFIPPHAPNFGGLWEAGVRSTKAHLKRVIGDATLTFEELTTVLTQIEACLNSRPMSYLSDNPNDPMPLTPGHFLVGEPLVIIPEETYDERSISSLQRWKLTQKMVNDFWKRWSNEYLVTLNQRYKWSTRKPEPEVNDVVIIKDHNLPPAKWLLGKVMEKHPGKDCITRVVTIKTKNGVCKRPCNKLYFLPKSENVQ